MKEYDFLQLLLPAELPEYFDITKIEAVEESFTIHLEEKNINPEQYKDNKLTSKRIYEQVIIHDFQ